MNTTCVVCNERAADSYFHTLGVCLKCRTEGGPADEGNYAEEVYRWLRAHLEARLEPAQQGALAL